MRTDIGVIMRTDIGLSDNFVHIIFLLSAAIEHVVHSLTNIDKMQKKIKQFSISKYRKMTSEIIKFTCNNNIRIIIQLTSRIIQFTYMQTLIYITTGNCSFAVSQS